MSQYWIAKVPGSTVTSSEAERVAVIGRSMVSTSTAARVAVLASTTTAGSVVCNGIQISSGIADVTLPFNITVSPSSKIIGTTARSTATAGGALTDTGILKVQCKSSTGGTLVRYIKLWAT